MKGLNVDIQALFFNNFVCGFEKCFSPHFTALASVDRGASFCSLHHPQGALATSPREPLVVGSTSKIKKRTPTVMVSVHFLVAGAGFEPIIARLCRLTSCGARHFLRRRYTPSPLSTAALRFARCIVHRTRSQPHPSLAPYWNASIDTILAFLFLLSKST